MGLLVSPKSELNPSTALQWLGKQFNFATRSICPTVHASTRLLAIVILFPLLPLHRKLLQRLAGTLLWSARPHLGSTIFLQPLYNRMFPPLSIPQPRYLGYAAHTACKCLLDLAAISCVGWHAAPHTKLSDTHAHSLFVDAALNTHTSS